MERPGLRLHAAVREFSRYSFSVPISQSVSSVKISGKYFASRLSPRLRVSVVKNFKFPQKRMFPWPADSTKSLTTEDTESHRGRPKVGLFGEPTPISTHQCENRALLGPVGMTWEVAQPYANLG